MQVALIKVTSDGDVNQEVVAVADDFEPWEEFAKLPWLEFVRVMRLDGTTTDYHRRDWYMRLASACGINLQELREYIDDVVKLKRKPKQFPDEDTHG